MSVWIGGALVVGSLGVVRLLDDEHIGWKIVFFIGVALLWVFPVWLLWPLTTRLRSWIKGRDSGAEIKTSPVDDAVAPERVIALTTAPAGSLEHRASQLSTLMMKAREGLVQDLYIYHWDIQWRSIVADNGFILLRFDIHSGSVYTVKIGTAVDGHIEYLGGEFKDEPEVRKGQVLLLTRDGRAGQLILRQWLLPAVVEWFTTKQGERVTLVLREVNVRVETEDLDGKSGPIERLALPNEILVDVPADFAFH